MIIRKKKSIKVVLDLEEFLNERFSKKNVSLDLLNRDLGEAKKYYNILQKMRERATDLKWFFCFSPVESNYFIADIHGVTERRMIGFEEVRDFAKYVVEEYGV